MPKPDSTPLEHELTRAAERLRARALRAQASAERKLFGTASDAPPLPQIAGRYQLLKPLGHGGQGEVWRAHDEQLDRSVALKRAYIRPGMSLTGSSDARAEARALGRLQHPNVVSVFDLGVDQSAGFDERPGGRAYIVMELVPGVSLERWLREEERSVSEILRVAEQIAAGLDAAHAIGLVHRDVKPANVLIGDDGRTRIADFGLAALAPDVESTLDTGGEHSERGPGGAVGTIVYMAPEQLAGEPTGPRADQFALAIVLFEALHGARPHEGATTLELLESKRRGPPPAPRPSRLRPPAHRALSRAMEPRPDARYPSVASMVEAIARAQHRRRCRGWIGLGVGLVLASGGLLPGWASEEPCTSAATHLAEVWNDERRHEVERAVMSTEAGFARSSADRAIRGLERFAIAWVEARNEACRVLRASETSPARLDSTIACYDRALRRFDGLVEVLAQADRTVVRKAVGAVASLPSLERCSHHGEGEASWRSDDPVLRARVDAGEQGLDRALALEHAGKYREALALASAIVVEAERLDHASLRVRALVLQGSNFLNTGRYSQAETVLTRAHALAIEGSMAVQAAQAAGMLVWIVGGQLARPDEGRTWWKHAEAQAVLADDELLLMRALANLANVEGVHSNHALAHDYRVRVLSVMERLRGPEHLETLKAVANLGLSASGMGQLDRAEALGERALSIAGKALGPDHPLVASLLNGQGVIALQRDDLEGARRSYERALAVAERALGPEHEQVASYLSNVGTTAEQQGDFDTAQASLERARQILENEFGPEHPKVAKVVSILGVVANRRGDFDQARRHHERAWAILTQVRGPDHLDVAWCHYRLGNLAFAQHEYDEATRQHRRALEIREAQLMPEHRLVDASVTRLGRIAEAAGRLDDAREYFTRALELRRRKWGLGHANVEQMLQSLERVEHARAELDPSNARTPRGRTSRRRDR